MEKRFKGSIIIVCVLLLTSVLATMVEKIDVAAQADERVIQPQVKNIDGSTISTVETLNGKK